MRCEWVNIAVWNPVIPINPVSRSILTVTSDRLINFVAIMAHRLSQPDRAPNVGPTSRAEAALTHPATLLALATLLVNDLLFKSLWPGSWWTGKLSDLAWVIFAPPLLALPLTFFARRNRNAQRAAWVIAYIGLPLLYAAYNTFEPLHDAVMSVFSLVRGTPGGSPFDPSDSIVIPIGFAVVVWVWRTVAVNSTKTKVRLSLVIAALACLASVATSYAEPPTGISVLSLDQSGNVVAKDSRDGFWVDYYRSRDGGFTWEFARGDLIDDESVGWNAPTAEAPEGSYSLNGTDVVLTVDGVPRIVHSTLNLNRKADYRIFAVATDSIGVGFRRVTHLPTDIHYDAASGNLIVAVGLQGVLLMTPDGKWQRIGVDKYTPIDFSIANRAKLIVFGEGLGTLSAALIIASLGFALIASTLPIEPGGRRYVQAIPVGIIATALAMIAIILITGFVIPPFVDFLGLSYEVVSGMAVLLLPFSVFVFIAVMVVVAKAFRIPFGAMVSTVLTLALFIASVLPLFFTPK